MNILAGTGLTMTPTVTGLHGKTNFLHQDSTAFGELFAQNKTDRSIISTTSRISSKNNENIPGNTKQTTYSDYNI